MLIHRYAIIAAQTRACARLHIKKEKENVKKEK